MIIGELARLQVDHKELLPVGSAARDGISSPATVVRETQRLQRHRTITAQFVGIEEHAGLTVKLILHIDHILILQTVVAREVPLAVMLARCTDLLITRQLGEAFQQLVSKGYLLQIRIRNLVLSLYPSGGLRAGVILQPAVRVAHFHTEVFIYGAVFLCLGILQSLGMHHRSGHQCHTHQ